MVMSRTSRQYELHLVPAIFRLIAERLHGTLMGDPGRGHGCCRFLTGYYFQAALQNFGTSVALIPDREQCITGAKGTP